MVLRAELFQVLRRGTRTRLPPGETAEELCVVQVPGQVETSNGVVCCPLDQDFDITVVQELLSHRSLPSNRLFPATPLRGLVSRRTDDGALSRQRAPSGGRQDERPVIVLARTVEGARRLVTLRGTFVVVRRIVAVARTVVTRGPVLPVIRDGSGSGFVLPARRHDSRLAIWAVSSSVNALSPFR